MGTLDKYGRLNSDLMLVGRGDPNLSGRTLPYNMRTERKAPPIQVLQALADQLVQHGLKYVDGDVVADDSYFVWERYGEGWSQDDLAREWGAPVSALTINDNVIFVNIMPADPAGRARVSQRQRRFPSTTRSTTGHNDAGGQRTANGFHQSRARLKRADLLGQHPAGRSRLRRGAGHRRSRRFRGAPVSPTAGGARCDRLRPCAHSPHRAGLDADVQYYLHGLGRRQRFASSESVLR